MAYDFKKEEDVQQFLENLGIEYRFGCFSEKNPKSCHLLGDYLEGVKQDFEKAAKIYRSNCDDSSFSKSCYKYGNYKFIGRGSSKNLDDAFKYYEKGCFAGEADACLNAGLMCVSNSDATKEFSKDYSKGFKLLNEACDKNIAFSCHYIAGMYIKGHNGAFSKDMGKAFEYSTKACDQGYMHACLNVAQMYRKGEGVEKNFDKFEQFNKKAALLKEAAKATTLEFQQGIKL